MKHIKSLLAVMMIFAAPAFAENKDVVTDTVTVKGTCGQCKKRIEHAAYIPGVKRAEWDLTSKILTVTYRSSKTSLEAIEHHIADAGHDAGDQKAPAEKYNQLPSCCAYNDDHNKDH